MWILLVLLACADLQAIADSKRMCDQWSECLAGEGAWAESAIGAEYRDDGECWDDVERARDCERDCYAGLEAATENLWDVPDKCQPPLTEGSTVVFQAVFESRYCQAWAVCGVPDACPDEPVAALGLSECRYSVAVEQACFTGEWTCQPIGGTVRPKPPEGCFDACDGEVFGQR